MKKTFSFRGTADGSRGDGLPIACGLASFLTRDPEGQGIAKPQALAQAETAGPISRVCRVSQPVGAASLVLRTFISPYLW